MAQVTKKQHYVWRNYLRPWTDNNSTTGRIVCLRENKIFTPSLMNIAHENYFYNIHPLSELERQLIYQMAIDRSTGVQREINEGWLNLYCAPFEFETELRRLSRFTGIPYSERIEQSQEFQNWKIEYIEGLHRKIELMGMQYLERIKRKDIAFWATEECRNEFSFFACNQYFRTKRIRDGIIFVCNAVKERYPDHRYAAICPENIWIPLSLIFASNVGANIARDFSAVLLQAEEGCFIVGDQPVINIHATLDQFTQPQKTELFYPITPHLALLFTKQPQGPSGTILELDAQEIAQYNRLEFMLSSEQTFAKDRSQLEPFLK